MGVALDIIERSTDHDLIVGPQLRHLAMAVGAQLEVLLRTFGVLLVGDTILRQSADAQSVYVLDMTVGSIL